MRRGEGGGSFQGLVIGIIAGPVSDGAPYLSVAHPIDCDVEAHYSFITIHWTTDAFKANHAKQRENCKSILDMRDHNGDQRDRKRFVFRGRPARTRRPRHLCPVRGVSKPRHSVGSSDLSGVPFTRGYRCHGSNDEPGSVVRRGHRCPIARRGKDIRPAFPRAYWVRFCCVFAAQF
jgi:hypothetical protein